MFVRKSKYEEEKARADMNETSAELYKYKFVHLQRKWNNLVERINRKGGEQFLDGTISNKAPPQFTKEEITKLIMLCHPDKHHGKPMAVELTQKLLKLKETVK